MTEDETCHICPANFVLKQDGFRATLTGQHRSAHHDWILRVYEQDKQGIQYAALPPLSGGKQHVLHSLGMSHEMISRLTSVMGFLDETAVMDYDSNTDTKPEIEFSKLEDYMTRCCEHKW